MKYMKILVSGGEGQLGTELKKVLPSANDLCRQSFDLTSEMSMRSALEKLRPDVLINCAAYTKVDLAEEDEMNFKINDYGVLEMGKLCREFNCQVIHLSTDYVFDGEQKTPYKEDDIPKPLNRYGLGKLEGEKKLIQHCPDSFILRTSWLYSSHHQNFLLTMKKLLHERDVVKVVNDQIGTPTWAQDLAIVLKKMVEKRGEIPPGIYHYSNEGQCSWFDFAYEIASYFQLSKKLVSIKSSEFPQKAKRPLYSVLSKEKIKYQLGIQIPHWKESVRLCLEKLSS